MNFSIPLLNFLILSAEFENGVSELGVQEILPQIKIFDLGRGLDFIFNPNPVLAR